MKAAQHKPAPDLHMSSKEFDRIMGAALQARPVAARFGAAKSKKKAARKKAA